MALVVAGLGLAFLPEDVIQIDVSADLILAVLVPPLLFEATVHISSGRLRRDLAPVLLFALVRTLLGAFVVGGFVAGFVDGVPWAAAVAFGPLISATDHGGFFRQTGHSRRYMDIRPGHQWEQLELPVGPAPKVFSQMVYHPGFGGMSDRRSGDAELWPLMPTLTNGHSLRPARARIVDGYTSLTSTFPRGI